MDLQLRDHVVLISGGAKGIGAAIAQALADEDAIPCILDRDAEAGQALVKDLARARRRAAFYACELTDCDAARRIANQALSTFGRIDCLVNNAGVNDGVGLDASVEAFRDSLERNLVHLFALTQACLPALAESCGSIVNISSKCAETGQGGTSGYAAAKGGVNALTREWALDLAPRGIRVNCVVPAEALTPQYLSWIEGRPDPGAAQAEIERCIPLGRRFTRPAEIAAAVAFLASRVSSHTTGQLFHVDGGYVHLDRAAIGDRPPPHP